MRYLTSKEAAEMLSDGLGRRVTARSLEDAVEFGRIRGHEAPGRGKHRLVEVAEIIRILEDARDNPDPTAKAWETLPKRSADVLWQTPWMERRVGRPRSEAERITAVVERLRAMEDAAGNEATAEEAGED